MVQLGTLWMAYGFARQKQHVFLARGLTPAVPTEEFEKMTRTGVIRDNCTLSAWGLYLLWKSGGVEG
ncbi:MAG TPA: hypothetical protein VH088_15150 [Terriglobales bacterium]|jgi:hypothetical protein|nr:hypothetical protein [Terriglobales bacterium]